MNDRDDRSDRLRKRFDRGDGESEERSRSTDADRSSVDEENDSEANGGESSVKDRPSVLMYLPEETRQELDIRFDELNARYKREHGEPLEKNRDYYPAVIRAGLEGTDVEDVLGL